MDKLAAIIIFIQEKRKVLTSALLTIGIFSALIDVFIILQLPQTYQPKAGYSALFLKKLYQSAKATGPDNGSASHLQNITEFTSPKNLYTLAFDKRYWSVGTFGSGVAFNLNKEYGSARLDIIEGESGQDFDSLTNGIIKSSPSTPIKIEAASFQGKPALSLTYKEDILGQDVYFQKMIVKADNKFFVFEKRSPALGYDQNYLENLLQSFSFNNLSPKQVKGIAKPIENLTTVELVDLIRPSIANIVYIFCLDIVNLEPGQSRLSHLKYQSCSSSKGSGFIVNDDGTVATNGHVVKVYPEEGLVVNLLNQASKDFTYDLIKAVYLSKGEKPNPNQVEQLYQDLNLNPQYLDRFLTEIFAMTAKKIISVTTSQERYYVNVGNEPISVDYQKIQSGDLANAVIPSQTTYTARLLDFDYPNKFSYEAIVNKNYKRGADVALLKIEDAAGFFPALELGSIESLREGSDVVIAGYPTLVEGGQDPRSALSYNTSARPTITKGIVSAVKQDVTGKTVLQTDASIDHGNSGGPAFNQLAQVIGLATFMTESKTGNFNFLRDVAELKELMVKNQVENSLGEVSNSWRAGLANFSNQYYQKAIEDFMQVKAKSLTHPTVDEFIKLSKEAVDRGESLEGLAGLIKGKNSNTLLLVFGGASGVSFMMAGFLAILPLFAKKETDVG